MNSWFHARSSANKWGGTPEDYIDIHEWIDGSKASLGDARHRALRHHTEGVWDCQRIFGRVLVINGRDVAVREIAERHIIEDLGRLPSFADYLTETPLATWMGGARKRTINLAAIGLKEPTA